MPANGAANAVVTPQCPRCGYDQSGAARWQTQCPLEGTCPECGLVFQWRDVLNSRFALPNWCVEYGSIWDLPRRSCRTLLKILRPRHFWSSLQMHHALKQWRIVAMLVIVFAVGGWLSFAISAGVRTWQTARESATIGARATPPWMEGLQAAAAPYWFTTGTRYGQMPGTAISKIRLDRIPTNGWLAIRFGIEPLPWGDKEDFVAERAFILLCTLVMCPVGFVLLPVSRRLAKVRWAHVHRITLYSAAFFLPAFAIDLYDQFSNFRYQWRGEISAAMLIGIAAMLGLWWAAATRCYLRMPHGWLVGGYVVAFGYLSQYFIFQCIDLAIVWWR